MSKAVTVIGLLSHSQFTLDPIDFSLAFQEAAEYGAKSALVCLVEKDHKKCLQIQHYRSALTSAVENCHAEVARYLIERGSLLLGSEIVKNPGSIDNLSLLMTDDPTTYSIILRQALNKACAAGHRDMAEVLVLGGANLNMSVDDDIYRLELPKRQLLSIGPWSGTALEVCLQTIDSEWGRNIFENQESIIKMLLENNANVNLTAGYGKTPLHSAVLKCTEETIRAMLEHGANANKYAPNYGRPLQCAARREVGSLPIVRLLLEAGAEIALDVSHGGPSSPVLRGALSLFEDEETTFPHGMETGCFKETQSLREVFSSGPGGVIKLLFQYRPELQAKDERFGLVLQMAAATGDEEFIQLLINRKVDVNLSGHYFGSALQAASRLGHIDCVQRLLEAGANINMVKGSHGTPLQAAIKGVHLEVIQTLINNGADVNRRLDMPPPSRFGSDYKIAVSSPIELAAESKSVLITELMINAGARIDPGSPVLHLAVEARSLEIVRLLIDAGAEVNSHVSGHDPVLITACGHGDGQIVELLLESGADANIGGAMRQPRTHKRIRLLEHRQPKPKRSTDGVITDGEERDEPQDSPLAAAARGGHVSVMQQLFEAGAVIHDPLHTRGVLLDACHGQQPRQTVGFLLQKLSGSSALTTAVCEEALSVARQNDDEGTFMVLLANLPKTPFTLCEACMLGSKDAVEVILAHGVDVNSDFDNGGRALHVAAHYQKSALIPLLIQKDADVCHVSSKFGAPLSAALEGLIELQERRLHESFSGRRRITHSRRAARNYFQKNTSQDFNTHSYSMASCEKIVGLLLNSGAVPNPEPSTLSPPLHLAARIGSLPLVQRFLEKGADINTTGGSYGSALLATVLGNHPHITKFLIAQGIDINIASPVVGTALNYACKHRKRWLMKLLLLEHGADINGGGGSQQESPLTAFLSCKKEYSDSVQGVDILLKHGNSLRISTEELLLAAETCKKGGLFSYPTDGTYILERLLDHDKNKPVAEEVIAAARKYCPPKVVDMLLERTKRA